jgi:tRNA threonylcarbamoyladenosine biosynthesis protein TsaE
MVRKDTVSPEDTMEFGACLGRILRAGDVLCLSGDLGAGKTHLSKGIAQGLGVAEAVTSPTYTIMQIYQGTLPVYHFDLYRLERETDLEDIGFEEYVYGLGVTIIEWADKFPEVLPAARLMIRIQYGEGDESNRHILLEALGTRYQLLLEELELSCTY